MEKPKNRFISVVYQLYTIAPDGSKNLEEQTGDVHPFEFITGFGITLDRFEEELAKHAKGDTFDFTLQPAEAFGEYVPEGKHQLSRDIFTVNGKFDGEHIFEGAVITLTDNEDHQFMAKVVKVEADTVTVDTNHPLAGKQLNFTGTMRENREATEEEVQQLIKRMTGGCGGCSGCGHHGEGEGCGHHGEGCGHCH